MLLSLALISQEKQAKARREVVHALAVGDAGHADLQRCAASDHFGSDGPLDQACILFELKCWSNNKVCLTVILKHDQSFAATSAQPGLLQWRLAQLHVCWA